MSSQDLACPFPGSVKSATEILREKVATVAPIQSSLLDHSRVEIACYNSPRDRKMITRCGIRCAATLRKESIEFRWLLQEVATNMSEIVYL